MIDNTLWHLIAKKYNNPNVSMLSIPIGVLGNFDYRYIVYDDQGKAISGYKRLRHAIKRCKTDGLYLTRILD